MPLRKRPPALRMCEFEALGRACKQMDAVAALLHSSGWSGKGMALVELSQAYETVARIYNRTEAAVLGLPPPHLSEASRREMEKLGDGTALANEVAEIYRRQER